MECYRAGYNIQTHMARQGKAWQGTARQGAAWRGTARLGLANQGKARLFFIKNNLEENQKWT